MTYHVDYIGTLLHTLGWSMQKLELRARERDEAEIQRWRREEWPRIKQGRKQKASVVFLDESGFLLQPLRRWTRAPRGQTPIHYAWDRHDRWSVIGALSLAPWALRIGVYFRLYDPNIVTDDVVEFVKHLHGQLGRKLILVGLRGTFCERLRHAVKCPVAHSRGADAIEHTATARNSIVSAPPCGPSLFKNSCQSPRREHS